MEDENEINFNLLNNSMVLLNKLPEVDSFLGMLDLKTGSMIISALCVLHPTIYGCTFFMPMSYLLLTIWFLLALFFTASVLLFYGLTNNDILLISTWIWYTLLFVATMFLLMFLLALFFISKQEKVKAFVVFLGILWYMLTIYFVLVVNSHRRVVMEAVSITKTGSTDSTQSPDTSKPSDLPSPNDPATELDPSNHFVDASNTEDGKETVKYRLKAFRKASGINNRKP